MKHTKYATAILIGLFLASQIVGLLIVDAYIDHKASNEEGKLIYNNLPFNQTVPEVNESYSFIWIFLGIIFGTVLFLFFVKLNIHFIWKGVFFIAVWTTLTYAFNSFMPSITATILGLVLSLWRTFRPNIIVHNFTEIFVYGGIAAVIFRMMNIYSISLFLLLISLYDMYAVWKSKHMVTLAKSLMKQKIFMGLNIPYRGCSRAVNNKEKKKTVKSKGKSVAITAILGGGDIGFPLVFASVVMKSFGFFHALIIPIFTTISLAVLFIYSKKGKYYPAMPFLSAGCFIGYGAVWLISLIP